MKIAGIILAVVGAGLLAAVVWRLYSLEQRMAGIDARTGRVEQLIAGQSPLVEFNGHGYVVVSTPMRWVDARAYAEKLGGYLVVVTSTEENQFVAELARSKNVYQAFWIGLSDEESEGQWKWVNGEPFDFASWEAGEPNGGRGENFVNSGHINPGKWNDANVFARHPFIVEFGSIKDARVSR